MLANLRPAHEPKHGLVKRQKRQARTKTALNVVMVGCATEKLASVTATIPLASLKVWHATKWHVPMLAG